MRNFAFCLALLLATGSIVVGPVGAQQPSPPVVKYGKWALLAGSITMNVLAQLEHQRADDAFDALQARCAPEEFRFRCETDASGVYLDAESEEIYQYSLRKDRGARAWLLAGESALLGSAAMFIWELTRRKTLPENIPFEPEVSTRRGQTRLGVRVAF